MQRRGREGAREREISEMKKARLLSRAALERREKPKLKEGIFGFFNVFNIYAVSMYFNNVLLLLTK